MNTKVFNTLSYINSYLLSWGHGEEAILCEDKSKVKVLSVSDLSKDVIFDGEELRDKLEKVSSTDEFYELLNSKK